MSVKGTGVCGGGNIPLREAQHYEAKIRNEIRAKPGLAH